ncbi:MAG: hypothetical protein JSR77_11445 [Planctomycetes bacterium]|nr:hypothetical protein [Planctomycetota bacterium]
MKLKLLFILMWSCSMALTISMSWRAATPEFGEQVFMAMVGSLWLLPLPVLLFLPFGPCAGMPKATVSYVAGITMATGVAYIAIVLLSSHARVLLAVLPPFPFAWHFPLTIIIPYTVMTTLIIAANRQVSPSKG